MIYALRPALPFTGTVPATGSINPDYLLEKTLYAMDRTSADGGAEWLQRGEAVEVLSIGISGSPFLLLAQQAMNATVPGVPNFFPGNQIIVEAVHRRNDGSVYVVPVTTQIALMGANGEIAIGEVYIPANLDPYALRVSCSVAWDLHAASVSMAGNPYSWQPIVKIATTRAILQEVPA